jgi:hypothetical protein
MEKGTPARDATRPLVTDTPRDFSELEAEVSPRWSPRVHRRGARAKFMAGLSGLKYALRFWASARWAGPSWSLRPAWC